MACRLIIASILISAGACAGLGAADATPVPAIPLLAQWEGNMLKFGAKHRATVAAHRDDPHPEPLIETEVYYDAIRVYLQIAAYTGDATWKAAAQDALHIYRDGYCTPNHGDIFGHRLFTGGMTLLARGGDTASRDAVLALATADRWTRSANPLPTASFECSRETAYALECLLDAQSLDGVKRPRIDVLVDSALGHYDQWFVSRRAAYVRPFMAGLTAEALIDAYDTTHDARIPAALATGLDWLWDHMWVPEVQQFRYTDVVLPSGGTDPTGDLNPLIAPAFAWLWHRTGEAKWAERGDQVFAGGVKGAYLDGIKQFYQSYRWSFAYVAWRSEPPIGRGPAPRTRRGETAKREPTANAVTKPAAPAAVAKPDDGSASTRPAGADPTALRAAVVARLRAAPLPVSATIAVLGEPADVEIVAADDHGVSLRLHGATQPLLWRDVADADLVRICALAYRDDAAALADAWRLAAAIRDAGQRDALGYRLLAIDADGFRALAASR